jgi:hypothetical protein
VREVFNDPHQNQTSNHTIPSSSNVWQEQIKLNARQLSIGVACHWEMHCSRIGEPALVAMVTTDEVVEQAMVTTRGEI